MTDRTEDGLRSASQGHLLTQSRPDVVVRTSRALGTEHGRPVVVVLGMHRSGTSLLSNVLHYLGVDMADMTDHVSAKNAGGFWERPELTAIHDEILAVIERPIGRAVHVLPFPPAWWRRKEVQALKSKLTAYVERELAKSGNLWGFKDPRTCRLLPLWWEVFRDLDLRPMYVHALRNPAEASVSMAQKSSARKMSAANGELMWLSYNYDIARFVTAEHPTIMVDYADWFAHGPRLARRLAEELGIGDDLTQEDIAECVTSIVRGEFRNQVEGREGVSSNVPLASMLYKAMIAAESHAEADLRGLRGQLRLVDLFFKSLAPVTEELDASLQAHSDTRAANATAFDQQALTIQSLIDQAADLATRRTQDEAATAALREDHDADVARARGEAGQLRQERDGLLETLTAVRAALEKARHVAASASDLAQQGAQERASLASQLAAMERDGNAMSERLEEAGLRLAQMSAAHDQAVERATALLDEATLRTAEHDAALAAMTARLEQHERRIARVIVLAKEWRRAQRHSRASLSRREEEGAALSGQVADLSEQVADGAAEIARLRTRLSRRADVATSASVFEWPADRATYALETALATTDAKGISGVVTIGGRADIVPIIDVRVNGRIVLALACSALPAHGKPAVDGEWHFFIPWQAFAPDQAGEDAVVAIAGLDHVIGEAPIPLDLRRYHVAPAVLAAELIGGTAAEAEEYHRWIVANEPLEDVERARAFGQREDTGWPRIMLVIFGGATDRAGYAATIASLRDQVYERWEAICIDGPTAIADLDPRLQVVAASDVDAVLAGLDDDAALGFVEAGDILAPTALLHLARTAAQSDDFALIYSDEDRIDGATGLRALPYVKAEWSADLALVQDYGSRLALVKRRHVASLSDLDSARVYALTLRAALAGPGAVIHLPYVLYHRAAATAKQADTSGRAALQSAVEQVIADGPTGVAGAAVTTVPGGGWGIEWALPDPAPRVSLIVPTRDRVDLLRVSVEGFLNETAYPNLEVLIADNESQEEDTLSYLAKVSSHPRVRVISCPGAFNFSTINNLAATHATGALIGLMNNDLKVIDPAWLRRMVSYAVRPDIGIVGAKLLHGDDTIQHAGVTLGIGTASHLYKSFPPDAAGRNGRLVQPQDLSAVTAACLLMRREVWDEVEGLDDAFPVAYNDVDLCLKVRAAGYRIVWVPQVLVYHLESQSRGKDVTPEKRARLDQDRARLLERWGSQLARDPFHSPNLSDRHIDSRLAFPSRVSPPWRDVAPYSKEQKR